MLMFLGANLQHWILRLRMRKLMSLFPNLGWHLINQKQLSTAFLLTNIGSRRTAVDLTWHIYILSFITMTDSFNYCAGSLLLRFHRPLSLRWCISFVLWSTAFVKVVDMFRYSDIPFSLRWWIPFVNVSGLFCYITA